VSARTCILCKFQ